MSNARIGSGATFAGVLLAVIAEVLKFSGPNPTVDDVEVSNMDSVDNWKEFIPGFKDGGELTLDLNYLKAQITNLYAALAVADTFTLTLPDASTFVFGGYLKTINQETPHAEKITANATFKVSGEPVYTAGA